MTAQGQYATIRHLVMPNHVECCTYPVIDWVAENMPEIQINVMDQYHPDMFTNPDSPKYQPKFESLSRRPNDHEILAAYRYARTKGVAFESVTFETHRKIRDSQIFWVNKLRDPLVLNGNIYRSLTGNDSVCLEPTFFSDRQGEGGLGMESGA